MERPVKLSLLGNDYLIRSDEDEEYVQEIAQFVRNKFEEINRASDGLSDKKTAILAAFHIASEYFQLLRQRDEVVKKFQERARKLNYQIDSVVE